MNAKKIVPFALMASLGLVAPAPAEADGKKLYDSKCAMCHGTDGVAKKLAAPSKNFNDPAWKKTATVEGIVKLTADGKGKMKGLADKLSPEEMTEVANYILTMAK